MVFELEPEDFLKNPNEHEVLKRVESHSPFWSPHGNHGSMHVNDLSLRFQACDPLPALPWQTHGGDNSRTFNILLRARL